MVSSSLKSMRRRKRETAAGDALAEGNAPGVEADSGPEKNLTLVLRADSYLPEGEAAKGGKRSVPPSSEGDGPSKKPRPSKNKEVKSGGAPKGSSEAPKAPNVSSPAPQASKLSKGKSVHTSASAPLQQTEEVPADADP